MSSEGTNLLLFNNLVAMNNDMSSESSRGFFEGGSASAKSEIDPKLVQF